MQAKLFVILEFLEIKGQSYGSCRVPSLTRHKRRGQLLESDAELDIKLIAPLL